MAEKTRTFAEIAREIKQVWTKPYFGAVPYINAMAMIDSSDKNSPYLCENAESITKYFLANAQVWRGEDAKRIKVELKSMIK